MGHAIEGKGHGWEENKVEFHHEEYVMKPM
jgi:hypothetical protein